MRKIVETQLQSVEIADLSNFNEETNTYYIPQKKTIKTEVNGSYLVRVKDSFFSNDVISMNWNKGINPKHSFLKIAIARKTGKMIMVDSIAYDPIKKEDILEVWSGWLSLDDIDVLSELH